MKPRAVITLVASITLLAIAYGVIKSQYLAKETSTHGDHNPRHGGVLLMAKNGFHHVEGTVVNQEFRLYIYDNLTKLLDARTMAARVGQQPLNADKKGLFLAIALEKIQPVEDAIPVWIRFVPNKPENLFVFPILDVASNPPGLNSNNSGLPLR